MFKALTHTFLYVLDQDEALDFYVGKLGLEVDTDADLGFMRWLTVNVPGQPESQIVLATPEMGHDEETAAAIRELVARGGGERRHLQRRRLPRHLRGARRQGRRVHAGADGALLRRRLRAARPLRQPAAVQPAGARSDRDPGGGLRARRQLAARVCRCFRLRMRRSSRPRAEVLVDELRNRDDGRDGAVGRAGGTDREPDGLRFAVEPLGVLERLRSGPDVASSTGRRSRP